MANSDGSWYEFDASNTTIPNGFVGENDIKNAFKAGDIHQGLKYKNTRFKFESNVPEIGLPGLLNFTPTGANSANYQERVAVPRTKDKDYEPAREVAVRMDYFLIHPGASKSKNVETDIRTYYPEPHVKRNGLSTFQNRPGAGTNPVPDGKGCEFVLLSQYGPGTFDNNFPKGNKGDVYGQSLPQGFTTFDVTGTYENFNTKSTTYTKDRTVFAVGVYSHDVTDYSYQSQIYPCYPGTNIRLTFPAGELIQNRFLIGLNTVTNGVSNSDGYFRWWIKVPSINNGQWFLAATLDNRDFTGNVAMQLANLGIGQYNGGNGKGYYLDNGTTANGLWYHNMSAYYRNGKAPVGQAPVVNLTSPANGTTFVPFSNINLTATASDPDGSVTKVEFFQGNTLLGTDNTAPYSFNWQNVPAGTYSITAKATDNSGKTKTSTAVTITVSAPAPVPQPPVVAITSPSTGTTFAAGVDINLTATASDPDGSVTKVEFFRGNTLLGTDNTAPYAFNWQNVPAGTYSITAKATDNSGLTKTSTAVSITVIVPAPAPQPPVVSITSPATGASFTAGVTVNLTATASDPDGSVTKVDFYYAGLNLLGTDNTAPYAFNWQNVPVGTHTLTAVATDNSGLKTTSASVTITVLPVTSQQPPLVSLTYPTNNATYSVGDNVTMTATASSVGGSIVKVEFWEGNTLLGSDNTSPYQFVWNTPPAGSYAIKAVAINTAAMSSSSAVANIKVMGPQKPPSVSITSPATGSNFTQGDNIVVSATAADIDGSVVEVKFYAGAMLLASDPSAPYGITWTNAPAGTYFLTAVATDNDGLSTTSDDVMITIDSVASGLPVPQKPHVSIVDPLDGASFNKGDKVDITAVASDPDGTIDEVAFYLNGTSFAQSSSSPYTTSLLNVQPGVYQLIAVATDNSGLKDSSSIVTYTVQAPALLPPLVEILTPIDGAVFKEGSDIAIEVQASDPDGSVTKVEIYRDNILIDTDQTAPYEALWQNAAPGSYLLRAIAYDNDGQSTHSSIVQIEVEEDQPYVLGLTFDAFADQGTVILSWSASEEYLVDTYHLMTSIDSILYTDLYDIPAVGVSASPTSYDDIDLDPFIGTSWYRLDAIGTDGSILESIVVKMGMVEPSILEKWAVYPNPLSGNKPVQMRAFLSEDTEVTTEISDAYGKVLYSKDWMFVTGQNQVTIPLSNFPPGMYYYSLRVKASGQILDTKIFIKIP